MLQILSGPDDYSIAQVVEDLKKQAGSESAFSAGITTLDGREVTPEQLANECGTVPFFASKRLVIIKGLLERFEPRGRSPRQRQTVSTRQRDEHESFSACFENVPDSTEIILIENSLSNSNPLLKRLSGRATVKTFLLLKGDRLKQWVQQEVRKRDGHISAQAVDLLVKLVGSNLWSMAGEIEKLTLFATGRRIEEDDVRTIVNEVQQADVFDMVDAILEGRAETASRALQQLLGKGAAPTYLLFMLCRQMRLAIRARELSTLRTPETEVQNRLGLPSPFVTRKVIEQASRHSLERLKAAHRRLLEADLWVKTGIYDGELAVEVLVAELCQRQQYHTTSVAHQRPFPV
ncbi:MAG: DNA polymerase III subunit delta [Chloroflexi bacterium]|nr:DNA polymerase III subunit delta [Chloroflexota bacterium]